MLEEKDILRTPIKCMDETKFWLLSTDGYSTYFISMLCVLMDVCMMLFLGCFSLIRMLCCF
jgi:hypothetical protein